MAAPIDPMSGIFIELKDSMMDGGELNSLDSIEILLLMNFVSLTFILSSSHLCSTIFIL